MTKKRKWARMALLPLTTLAALLGLVFMILTGRHLPKWLIVAFGLANVVLVGLALAHVFTQPIPWRQEQSCRDSALYCQSR